MSNEPLTLKALLPAGMSGELFSILVAGVVAVLCVVAVSRNFSQRDSWSSRIRSVQQRRRELLSEASAPKKRKKPESSVNFMRAVSMKLELVRKLQLEKAETTLIQGGFRSKDAILIFAFMALVLPFALLPLGITVMNLREPVTFTGKIFNMIWPVLGFYAGMKLPWLVISRVRKKRLLALQRALSDTLDLMTVCAEAGLSLSATLDRVSRELGVAYPEMAEELTLTALEMGFLPDRNKALSNLADRTGLKEVRGIVSVLIQTEKYGTPIAQALRVLAAEFRQARMMRAEAKAARLPALMTVPMIVFILPTLFIIIIAPAAISTMNNFKAQEGRETTGK